MSKRTMVAATATAALALPAAATAAVPRSTVHRYKVDYHAVAHKFGTRAPGRNIAKWGLAGGQRAAVADLLRSIATLERMLHPAPVVHVTHRAARLDGDGDHDGDVSDHTASAAAPAPSAPASAPASSPARAPSSGYSSGGLASVPGVPSSFAACVASRESSNGQASSNVYGIIPASGYNVSGMSVAQQKQVFRRIYQSSGRGAWAPYDGC